MANIERFEDIQAWQEARKFVKDIYDVTNKGNITKDYSLRDQIRRASVSVMSNIAEGFERQTDKEFKRFLFISKGSAGEIRSLLFILKDLSMIDEKLYLSLNKRITEISKMIGGLIKYLWK